MKLLTLNTHSLIEQDYPRKLSEFVAAIEAEQPMMIALQEVNQTCDSADISGDITGYHPCCDAVLRSDNHVYNAARLLRERGVEYFWTWLPIKKGYGRYDEGVALMSRSPILETEIVTVSTTDNYDDWRTRKLLGVRTEALPDEWFFSVHFGRWDDKDEPFREQWIRTAVHMTKHDHFWLMGDFNSPAGIPSEGYDIMKRSCCYDSYDLAYVRDVGTTVASSIDGWRDRGDLSEGMRIDQIWCSKKVVITSSEVIFNGIRYPVISDHFGVMVNYERSIV